MPRIHDIPRQLVNHSNAPAQVKFTRLRQERNHPVPLDEFDRERMGIAAKE